MHKVDAHALPHLSAHALSLGRAETGAKEYLPFPALLGSILAERKNDHAHAQFLIPQTQGAEADGQYARVIRAVLDRRKEQNAQLISQCWKHCPKWRRTVTHSSAHCWREISSMLLRQINVQTFRHSGMLCPAGSSCTQRRERSEHFSPKAAALPLLVRRSA